jgi:hypothetical protein
MVIIITSREVLIKLAKKSLMLSDRQSLGVVVATYVG